MSDVPEKVRLTKREIDLLKIVAVDRSGNGDPWFPNIDRAHPKHQPTLRALRARGLIDFTWDRPRIVITPAGRSALHQEQDDA